MSTKTVNVELPAEIFDVQVNIPLIHQVVVAQQAAARQGSADTKSRGEVRGGGRKPYKQKGTGRARQGSTRAPQFAGGGVVHGPTPRSFAQRTPKKMKAAALRGALSDRARAGRIHVVDGFVSGDTPSTKTALDALAGLTDRPRTLVVMQREDAVTWLSLRNVESVHLIAVDQLNTYDVLLSDDVVFTKGAFETFVGADVDAAVATTAKPVKAADASTKTKAAAKPTATDGPYGAASAEPLDNGDAPEGFTIKGNKSSKKYHRPDGRWYEQTTAEVWFATAEDAEAAGFIEAGTKAKTEGEDN